MMRLKKITALKKIPALKKNQEQFARYEETPSVNIKKKSVPQKKKIQFDETYTAPQR